MTFFEKEMRSFFGRDSMIATKTFYDKYLFGELNGDTAVKISFDGFGKVDEFQGFFVKIINKKSGLVDEQKFLFADIIGKVNTASCEFNPHIDKGPSGWGWYIHNPTEEEREKIIKIIKEYIYIYA